MIYLLLYVDHMLIAYKERKHIDNVKCILKSKFKMKELGPAKRILGMEINRIGTTKFCTYLKSHTFQNF